MKILVVNRNYFITGGPEQYLFRLEKHMPECEFIPFCVDFPENRSTPYRKYFLEPPGSGVYFKDFRLSPRQKVEHAVNNIYSFTAKRHLAALIRDTRPDVAYFLNAVYFTDSIIDACHEYGVPIVWRMSDFNKVCASYHLLRDGKICEACLSGGLRQAVRYKCGGYQRSTAAALVKVAGMSLSRWRNAYARVRYFVTPSEFTRRKLIEGGFPAEQVVYLPTLIETEALPQDYVNKSRNILYVGRLTEEKGVDVLLKAFASLAYSDVTLTIAGDHKTPYAEQLLSQIPDRLRERITLTGFVDADKLRCLYQGCAFFVIPSLWYENLPNVALEGMAQGRAAIVSNLGSLSEIIQPGISGLHFHPGDHAELAAKMEALLVDPETTTTMGRNAAAQVKLHNAPAEHVLKLMTLFSPA